MTRTFAIAKAGAFPQRLRVGLSAADHAGFVGSKTATIELAGVTCDGAYGAFSVTVGTTWIGDFSVERGAATTHRLAIPPSVRIDLPRAFPISITVMRGAKKPAPTTFRVARITTAGTVVTWRTFRSRVPDFVRVLHATHLRDLGFERDGARAVTRWRRWSPDEYLERYRFDEDLDTPRPVAPLVLPLTITVELIGERGGDLGHWSVGALSEDPAMLALGEGVDAVALREAVLRSMLVASDKLHRSKP